MLRPNITIKLRLIITLRRIITSRLLIIMSTVITKRLASTHTQLIRTAKPRASTPRLPMVILKRNDVAWGTQAPAR